MFLNMFKQSVENIFIPRTLPCLFSCNHVSPIRKDRFKCNAARTLDTAKKEVDKFIFISAEKKQRNEDYEPSSLCRLMMNEEIKRNHNSTLLFRRSWTDFIILIFCIPLLPLMQKMQLSLALSSLLALN